MRTCAGQRSIERARAAAYMRSKFNFSLHSLYICTRKHQGLKVLLALLCFWLWGSWGGGGVVRRLPVACVQAAWPPACALAYHVDSTGVLDLQPAKKYTWYGEEFRYVVCMRGATFLTPRCKIPHRFAAVAFSIEGSRLGCSNPGPVAASCPISRSHLCSLVTCHDPSCVADAE